MHAPLATDDYAFGHWFAGFVDGEGSFLIVKRADPRYREDCRYYCRLVIEVRDDEEAILREIQQRFGIGSIQHLKARGSAGAKPLVRWQVTSRQDLVRLVEIFTAFPLRAKKAADFAVWKRAVVACGERDWESAADLKAELTAARTYVDRRLSVA